MLETIIGLEVTPIEPEYVEPEALINLETIYQEKLARRPDPNPCEACEAYEKILDALLK